nr:hypothetical protein [Tanacetum cinerariifolium]
MQENTEKISQIKDRLKAARDRQKIYADKRRKPLEFNVGDHVLLKVSPWKVRPQTLPVGSPVLPPPQPVRPHVLPPRSATVDRPALCVVIFGGIIYTREDIGNIRVCGRTCDQDGQGGDRGIRANEGIDEVLDFSTVITQQLKNLFPTIIAQVGSQASNIQGDVRNVSVNNSRGGCSYKEFLACNPKDYDVKGGAISYTCWTKKIETVQDMSGCRDNQKEDFKALMREELCPNNEMQKLETEFWCHAMVGAGHAVYTDRFHELARLVPHLVTPENKRIERYIYILALQIRKIVVATEVTRNQSVILKAGVLTDEAIRNGSLKKNTEKRGNGEGPSMDRNVRNDNQRSRIERAFASTTNCVRRRHFAKDCRARPRMVNLLNAKNTTTAHGACYDYDGTDSYKAACPSNQARGRAYVIGAEEARQDQNIMTAEMLRGLNEQMKRRSDEALYYLDRIWVPLTGDVRTLIMDEAHKSKYSLHPGADKMYYDLRDMYWWPRMKKDIALQHGRMILESVENGPLFWPTIEENGVTRPKKYFELSATEAIQADCDVKATNIILQGLPLEVYALVSNHKVSKELWERIQLFMQGTSLTKQERECELNYGLDKFAYKKG